MRTLFNNAIIAVTLIFGVTASYGQSNNCSPATTYNNGALCVPVAGTNAGSNTGPEDSYAAADICALSVENTIWYTFTAPTADTYTVTWDVGACGSGFGLQTGVLTGPCGGPYTSLNCSYAGTGVSTSYTFVAGAGQQVWLIADGDGGDQCPFNIDICGTACAADVGTITILLNGVATASPVYLCADGTDCIDLISNNDFVLPPAQPGELAELMYALYTCPPTTGDPATDPCYTGSLWSGQDFLDCNPSTYGLTGPFYWVPITADDSDNGGNPNAVIHWDQNGDGCFDQGAPILINWLSPITFVATPDPCTGEVDIVVSGGLPEGDGSNYIFTNTGSGSLAGAPVTHGGTITVTGLTNGDGWNVTIDDGKGCTVTIASGTYLGGISIDNVVTVDPTCNGDNDGSIVITGSTGTPSLTYSIDNGVTFQASNSFAGLPVGSYDIVIEDAGGCQATTTVVLTNPPAVSIDNIVTVDPTCNGDTDGSIIITASGGTGALSYSIDNGVTFQASNSFTGLPAASYDLVVEDATGCQALTTVVLTDPPAVNIDNVATVDPTCNGDTDGTIVITASGGTGTLTYSIDNGVTFQASNSFTGLPAASYDLVVEDATGCQA
ncbi:MAG: hypothetical protein ACI9J3_001089, partial [Parvicellaceae bacterium]